MIKLADALKSQFARGFSAGLGTGIFCVGLIWALWHGYKATQRVDRLIKEFEQEIKQSEQLGDHHNQQIEGIEKLRHD